MSRHAAGIALALLAALLFAAAGALQHFVTRSVALATASQAVPAETPHAHTSTARVARSGWLPVLALLSRLLRSRIWLYGLACNVLGFVVHASALHLGSIIVVQALLAVQLLFALPFATIRLGRAPLARDWLGTLAICTGLITLLLLRGAVPQTVERRGWVPIVATTALLLVAALMATARTARLADQTRTALVAVAAGIGFSVTAVFTVVVTDELARQGFWGTMLDWPVYCLALSGLIAALLVQDAFTSGSFPTALTAMTIADPLASWIWGAALFDAQPPTSPAALASLVVSGTLIVTGVVLLANSPTLDDRQATRTPQASLARD